MCSGATVKTRFQVIDAKKYDGQSCSELGLSGTTFLRGNNHQRGKRLYNVKTLTLLTCRNTEVISSLLIGISMFCSVCAFFYLTM